MRIFKHGCSLLKFPFYIWMIVGVIIYLIRCSITVVKLVGSSAVSVLATLFLLSYAKLQRAVINAFSFTYLLNYHGDGRSVAIWLFDGNVPFLQGKHIALLLMALSVSVFFILPFMHPAILVCPLHTSLQPFPIQVGKDEALAPAGCIPRKTNFAFGLV